MHKVQENNHTVDKCYFLHGFPLFIKPQRLLVRLNLDILSLPLQFYQENKFKDNWVCFFPKLLGLILKSQPYLQITIFTLIQVPYSKRLIRTSHIHRRLYVLDDQWVSDTTTSTTTANLLSSFRLNSSSSNFYLWNSPFGHVIVFQQVYWIVASNNKNGSTECRTQGLRFTIELYLITKIEQKVPKLIEIIFKINNNNKIDPL